MPVRRATDEPLQQDVQKHAREGRAEHTAAGGGGGDSGGVGAEAGPEQDGSQEFQVRGQEAILYLKIYGVIAYSSYTCTGCTNSMLFVIEDLCLVGLRTSCLAASAKFPLTEAEFGR